MYVTVRFFATYRELLGEDQLLLDVDDECYSGTDCNTGLCTLTGFCSNGAAGDGCRDNEDCLGDLSCGQDQLCQ